MHWYAIPGLAVVVLAFVAALITLKEKPPRWMRATVLFAIIILTAAEIRNLVAENNRVTEERKSQDDAHAREIQQQLSAIYDVGQRIEDVKAQQSKTNESLKTALQKTPTVKSLNIVALELSRDILAFLADRGGTLFRYDLEVPAQLSAEALQTSQVEAFHHRIAPDYHERFDNRIKDVLEKLKAQNVDVRAIQEACHSDDWFPIRQCAIYLRERSSGLP